jgi:hypothetical protein
MLNSIRLPSQERALLSSTLSPDPSNPCEVTGHGVNFRQHLVMKFVGR